MAQNNDGIRVSDLEAATSISDEDLLMIVQKTDEENRTIPVGTFLRKENGDDISTNNVTVGTKTTTLAKELSALESKDSSLQKAIDEKAAKTDIPSLPISSISKNGTKISPDSNKNVNVTVPTKVSELTNDSKFVKVSQTTDKILVSQWTGDSAPYKCTISTDKPAIIRFDSNSTAATSDVYAAVLDAEIQGGNGNQLYAWGAKPTVDIPVIIFTFE